MSLNPVIHQPARLRIMSALSTLSDREQVDFTYLKKNLGLTDGNLGAHLARLEQADYLRLDKRFVERKPRTFIAATDVGRLAFARHVEALEAVLRGTTESSEEMSTRSRHGAPTRGIRAPL